MFDRLNKLVIDIYIDYNLTSFPIDVFKLAKRMGLKLIKYSSFEKKERELLIKESKNGFYSIAPSGPIIFYNDLIDNKENIRMTIAHEIKHYVDSDCEENETSEKGAKHFARYLLCPIPYLISNKIKDVYEIMTTFGLSYTASTNAQSNVINRVEKYGYQIFDYEKTLLKLLNK